MLKKEEEIGYGVFVLLPACWIYVVLIAEIILAFAPLAITSIEANSLLYNVLACYGMVKIIQKIPWFLFVEMFVRLHARFILTLPLILLELIVAFTFNIVHSFFMMFSSKELTYRRTYTNEPPLERIDLAD